MLEQRIEVGGDDPAAHFGVAGQRPNIGMCGEWPRGRAELSFHRLGQQSFGAQARGGVRTP
jgi:hypothetical protein